jgi:acyl-CoA thioester hydrolase
MNKKFVTTDRVRWSDVDRAGIIYYGRFQRFFEVAETELFREVGLSYAALKDHLGIWLPRVQTHFDYRSPLLLDDLIEVRTWVGRIGNRSLTLQFEVFKDEGKTLVADGRIVLACVLSEGFQSTPVPQEMRQKLAAYTESSD